MLKQNKNDTCLISYQDNFQNKGDIPFTIFFNFETTAPTDNCLDPEQKKMFVLSYVMIVAFQPALKLNQIIIYRIFAHPIEQLAILNYCSGEQISFIELHLINMLRDMAFDVSKRKYKNSVGQMLSIESAMVKKTLLEWFNIKIRRRFEKVNPVDKSRFERLHPIYWKKDKCVICKFPMKMEPTNYLTPDNEKTYGDFVIRYEHKFLRNIYTEK